MTELIKATAGNSLFAPQQTGFSPLRNGRRFLDSLWMSLNFARKCEEHYNRHGFISHEKLEEIYTDLERSH